VNNLNLEFTLSNHLLTPRFLPWKILRVKSQHALFGWHSEILPEFITCVEQEVGSHQRQVYGRYMFVCSKVELACFPMHLRNISTYNNCCYFLGYMVWLGILTVWSGYEHTGRVLAWFQVRYHFSRKHTRTFISYQFDL